MDRWLINKKYVVMSLFVLAASALVFNYASGASDYISTRIGYYTGRAYENNGAGRAVIEGGFDEGLDKNGYLNFLFSKNKDNSLNDGGYPQNKNGSAFVFCSMLGAWPAKSCRDKGYIDGANNITNDGRSRLEKIVNSDSVSMKTDLEVHSTINTVYNTIYKDFFYVDLTRTKPAYVFTQTINGVAKSFRVYIDCANPLGDLGLELPNDNWNVAPILTTDVSEVRPGDPIKWTLTAKITGPSRITEDVDVYYRNMTDGGGFKDINKGGLVNIPENWGQYDKISSNSHTTNTNSTDYDGMEYCRQAYAEPGSMKDSILNPAPNISNKVCVKVKKEPTLGEGSVCRPIKFAVEPKTYSSVTHSTSYNYSYSPPVTVPVRASTSLQSWGPFGSSTIVDATSRHTTGDSYVVTFSETDRHVVGYVDEFNIKGSEILDYSDKIIGYEQGDEVTYTINDCTKTDEFGNVVCVKVEKSWDPPVYAQGDPIIDSGPRSYEPKRHNWLYSGTRTVYAEPTSWTTTIGPCYNYELEAKINAFGANIEAGGSSTVRPSVTSSHYNGIDSDIPHTKSMSTNWYITTITIPPNNYSQLNSTNGEVNKTEPCDHYNPNSVGTCSVSSGSAVFSTSGSTSSSLGTSLTAPDAEAGTRVCVAFSLKNSDGWDRDDTNSKYTHSSFSPTNNCITVVKKPKVQVWGGDLWARGSVNTSRSVKSGLAYGSWAEYGIFAADNIYNMASGAALAGNGVASSYNSSCNYSTLSFTNVPRSGSVCTGASGTIGNYSGEFRNIPDVSASFPTDSSTSALSSGSHDLTSLSGLYKLNSDITITGGNIAVGKWIVINAPNSVITIDGDIRYSSQAITKISDIPQVVIIASAIKITNNVNNIDAWLIAKNSINTCSSVGLNSALTINDCTNKLVVNGPVMADALFLRRTAGSGIGIESGVPAEVFNTRPDAYLWAFSKANTSGRVQTVYSSELPPRF